MIGVSQPLQTFANAGMIVVWSSALQAERRSEVRGFKLTVLGLVMITSSFVVLGVRPDGIASFYRDTLTPAAFGVWLSCLILATLSPPVLATAFWFSSKRLRHGWVFHLLLVPATYALVRGAITVMLSVAGEPDSDGPTGWATDPAVTLMLVCPVIYVLALGFTRLSRRRPSTNAA